MGFLSFNREHTLEIASFHHKTSDSKPSIWLPDSSPTLAINTDLRTPPAVLPQPYNNGDSAEVVTPPRPVSLPKFLVGQSTDLPMQDITKMPEIDWLTLESNRIHYREDLGLMDGRDLSGDDVSPEIDFKKSPKLSESHALGSHDLSYTTPKLMDTPRPPLSTTPESPARISGTYNISTHDKAQPAVAMPGGTTTIHGPTTEVSTSLAGRDRSRLHLDSSSSYYTSNASSRRSSIDLSISPVPPIPAGIITGKLTKYASPYKTASTVQSLNAAAAHQKNNLESTDKRDRFTQGRDVGIMPDKRKDIIGIGSSTITHISQEDGSKTGSSIWEVGCPRRPLLTEAGKNVILVSNKQWELSNEKLDKHRKTGTHKKSPSDGFISNDVTCWLDDQYKIGKMRHSPSSEKRPRSIFKNTFTKSMSKLRIRIGANLKSTGALPLGTTGTMKNTMRDGRGEFSPLNTPSESIITDRTTIIGDYINVHTQDVTPNSEQTMANITFTPSLPTELRLDGSLEAYDEFQATEPSLVELTTIYTSRVVTCPTEEDRPATPNLVTPANKHRFSAVYDDCVLVPYLDDRNKDDSDCDTN